MVFTNSRPLLETIGSTSQVAEKAPGQSVAYLKQCLEHKEFQMYLWIEGKDIVADILTKQGSKRYVLDEEMIRNIFNMRLMRKLHEM